MSGFTCPVCGEVLIPGEKASRCEKGHAFDRARSGYLNLLLSSSTHGHGDDKEMLKSRRAFLEAGFYEPLVRALAEEVIHRLPQGGVLLDAGCGEGYYLRRLLQEQAAAGKKAEVFGVDVSKTAVDLAAKSLGEGQFAVASVYRLPFGEACCDGVLSLFSPHAPEEFLRVLKPGGLLFRAYPKREHLWELKSAVYDTPLPNRESEEVDPGFQEMARREIAGRIFLQEPGRIRDLFAMTPYAHKTAPRDREKLLGLASLETRIHFGLQVWKKI